MALLDALRRAIGHPMRAYYIPIAGGVVLGASTFMPWIAVGSQRFGGVPDPAGIWVLGLALLTILLAGLSIVTRKNSRHPLLLVGLFAFGVLLMAERLMERAATQQEWAAVQARAIVLGSPVGAMAEAAMAPGAYIGLGASTVIALFGLTVVVRRVPQIRALPADDDV